MIEKLRLIQVSFFIVVALLFGFIGFHYYHYHRVVTYKNDSSLQVTYDGPIQKLSVSQMLALPDEELFGYGYSNVSKETQYGYWVQGLAFVVIGIIGIFILFFFRPLNPLSYLLASIVFFALLGWIFFALSSWADPYWRVNSIADQLHQEESIAFFKQTYANLSITKGLGFYDFDLETNSYGRRYTVLQSAIIGIIALMLAIYNLILYFRSRKASFSTNDILDSSLS